MGIMNAPVQIRKSDTVERLRRLAILEGKTITELVDEMVRERDRQYETQREADVEKKLAEVREIVRHFNSLPIIGPLLTDDDFYDASGFPK